MSVNLHPPEPWTVQASLLWSRNFQVSNRRVTPQGERLPVEMVEAHRVINWADTGSIGLRTSDMIAPDSLQVFEAEPATGPDAADIPYRVKESPLGADIELRRGNVDLGPDAGEFVYRVLNRPPFGAGGDSLVQLHPGMLGKLVLVRYESLGTAVQAQSMGMDHEAPGHIKWLDFSIFPEAVRQSLLDHWIAVYRSRGYVLWDGTSPEDQGVANPYGVSVADLGDVMSAELHLRARQLADMGAVREDSVLTHEHLVEHESGGIYPEDIESLLALLVGVTVAGPGAWGSSERKYVSLVETEPMFNEATQPLYQQRTVGASGGFTYPGYDDPYPAWSGSFIHAIDKLPVRFASVAVQKVDGASARTNQEENRVKERGVAVLIKIR